MRRGVASRLSDDMGSGNTHLQLNRRKEEVGEVGEVSNGSEL